MVKAKQRDIFREVAAMSGDTVFRYDMQTDKFMQYTDKEEVVKYGSWIFDFAQTTKQGHTVHPDDLDTYREVMKVITTGHLPYFEGEFRIKTRSNGNFRWYRVTEKTIYDTNGKPIEVIGRFLDINEYKMQIEAYKDKERDHVTGIASHDGFLDAIVRYSRKTENPAQVACILMNIPQYDDLLMVIDERRGEELLVNITRRLRRSFPYGTIIGRVGVHRFGAFTSGMNLLMDISGALGNFRESIRRLGDEYGINLSMNAGISILTNSNEVSAIIYDQAEAALKQADRQGSGSIVFYHSIAPEEREQAREEAALSPYLSRPIKGVAEVFNKELVNYAFKSMAKKHDLRKCVDELLEKVGKQYHIDRIAISISDGEEYTEYSDWCSWRISDLQNGRLLHLNGESIIIEEKLTRDVPYVVNRLRDYPDDSVYGRMVNSTALNSVAQGMFECQDGRKGIISFEAYHAPHWWTKEELATLSAAGDIAEAYMKHAAAREEE